MRPPALMPVFLNLCSWAVEQMHEWEGVLGSEVTISSSLTILFSDLECVTGHNCTSVPARVATCVSRLCHTNTLVCVVLFTSYVIKGWVRALVEKIQNPPEMHPTGNLEWFVFCLSKNVSLRPMQKHSVTANSKLLVITSVISMSFPPAYTLFSDSLSRLRLISHQEACLERLQVVVDVNFGMKLSWEWSLCHRSSCRAWTIRPVPLLTTFWSSYFPFFIAMIISSLAYSGSFSLILYFSVSCQQ